MNPRALRIVDRLPRPVADGLLAVVRRVPALRRRLEAEYDRMIDGMRSAVRPPSAEPARRSLPEQGVDRDEVLARMARDAAAERPRWEEGYASGAVYHGGAEHLTFLERVFSLHSQSNPLHPDLWPATVGYEAEIVAMTAGMLGRDAAGEAGDEICGTVTSGGTESIVLAMKAYRDRARAGGIDRSQIVAPVTAHAAFDKAAHLLGMDLVTVPVDDGSRADPAAVARAVGGRTAVIVASAPSFPHGTIDPVANLAALARERAVGCHVDACLGGFVLPWAERLGYPVPPFDFRIPGVTSMSVDTHKYGYAPKGSSVVLYRGRELRRHQYFTVTDWPGGLYMTTTLAGSRPGVLSAACWAALVSVGEDGYLEATRRILETAATVREGIGRIPGLTVIGDPLWVIAFGSDTVDIYRVADAMAERGWSLNGLQRPAAVHLAVTLRHTRPGVADRFLADLAASVDAAGTGAGADGGTAPIYGMAGGFPARAVVADLLERYGDLLSDL
jgi:sphinganine-1-phosphate aldolase